MEEKNLNSKESLELIAQMIQATKSKLKKGGSIYFLVWGYVALLTTIAVYTALTLSHNQIYNWIWFAIPLIGIPLMSIIQRKTPRHAFTFIERVIGYVWMVIGGVVMIVPIISIFVDFRFPVLTVIGILLSVGVTLTGLIIEFKTYWISGILCIALSFSTLFFAGMNQIIIYAIIIIFSMIIPGHVLKHKENLK